MQVARCTAAAGRWAALAALISCFHVLPARAQDPPKPAGIAELHHISFVGATAFSDAVLQTAILSTSSPCRYINFLGLCFFGRDRRDVDPIALQGDALRLRVFYYERGYREAKVAVDSARDHGSMNVTFTIDEGRPVTVSSVELGGLEEVDSVARVKLLLAISELPLRAGEPLSLI